MSAGRRHIECTGCSERLDEQDRAAARGRDLCIPCLLISSVEDRRRRREEGSVDTLSQAVESFMEQLNR